MQAKINLQKTLDGTEHGKGKTAGKTEKIA